MTDRKHGNGGTYNISTIAKEANIVIPSRQLEMHEYLHDVIQPPLEPDKLIEIVQQSDCLGQLISAMATNICSFGYGIRYKTNFDYNKAEKELQKKADQEWETITEIYENLNPIEGLENVLYKAIYDRECIGYGTIEVLRDTLGQIAGMEYCRAANVRLVAVKNNKSYIKVWQKTKRGYEQYDYPYKFKKFAQIINGNKVYFKEFGDKRMMDCQTGEYKEDVPEERQATELLYLNLHNPASDYGLPRWVGAIVNALGSRLSEELNINYFLEGKIIPLAITVNNGKLTEESLKAVSEGKGVNMAHKWLLLEAYGDEGALDTKENRVSIDIKPLTDVNTQDAQFSKYQSQNKDKIRSTFRVPPIYTGDSSDYNRATADTAKKIAEEQVFSPDRENIVRLINTIVNNEAEGGVFYCEMYLKGPEISNSEEIANALDPYIKSGTITANMLIPAAEKLLNVTIEPLPSEIGDVPFELVKMLYQQNLNQNANNTNIQKSELTAADALLQAIEELKDGIKDD